MQKPSIVPVLLGLDLNAYSMAISFYEAFGVTSHAFGRYTCGITEHSRFIKTHKEPNMTDPAVGVPALIAFAEAHRGALLLLVPCADWYMALAEGARERLGVYYRFFLPPRPLFRAVSDKASFYRLLEKHGLPYPRTLSFSALSELKVKEKDFSVSFPAVLKASDSTEYYRHPFDGMRKVYFPKNREELHAVAARIFASGYKGELIFQEKIGKTRAEAKTLTVCADSDSVVRRAVLGTVLLEETAPGARGNYAAILTEPPDDLTRSLCGFVRTVGYTGIGNFDLLYDEYGRGYVLEMNPRQGRSCDYVRAAGISLAEFLYAAISGGYVGEQFRYPRIYWRAVGDTTVARYAENRELLARAMRLKEDGFAFSPFFYAEDLRRNPVRRVYVGIHTWRRGNAFAGAKAGAATV